MDTRTCYIYAIINKKNGKRYVGSSIDLGERWTEHKRDLRCNRHHCRYLQNAWNKYGEASFEFVILAELPNNERATRWLAEIAAIKELPSYNSRKANDNMQNFENSPEVRSLISSGLQKFMAEKPENREIYLKRGREMAALMRTPEHRARMAKQMKKQWSEDKELSARRLAGVLARWEDPEARIIQSQKLIAAKSSPEARKRISEASKKMWANPTPAMINTRMARWADPEAKARQAEKMRAYHAARRAQKALASS